MPDEKNFICYEESQKALAECKTMADVVTVAQGRKRKLNPEALRQRMDAIVDASLEG